MTPPMTTTTNAQLLIMIAGEEREKVAACRCGLTTEMPLYRKNAPWVNGHTYKI